MTLADFDPNTEGLYDRADQASLDAMRADLIGRAERLAEEAALLQRAQAKVEAGTYGTCEACAGAIPPERLAALPAAPFCLGCQEAAEREAARAWTPPSRATPHRGPFAGGQRPQVTHPAFAELAERHRIR